MVLLLLSGCGEKSGIVRRPDEAQQPVRVSEPKQSPGFKKTVPPDERVGFAYNGLLRKDLRDSGMGWPLRQLSVAFDIPILDKPKPDEYKDIVIPYELTVGNDENAVTFRLDTARPNELQHLNSAEGANAAYKVIKQGREVQMRSQPFTYHGGDIQVEPLEILRLLHIDYILDGQTYYIKQKERSPIEGKVFFDKKVAIDNGQETEVRIVYRYDQDSNQNYDEVELIVGGESVPLVDHNNPGSSDYYEDGFAESVTYRGETLLAVYLDEDVIILQRSGNGWKRLLSPEQYRSFWEGSLSLRVDQDGTGAFVDADRRLEHRVSVSGGMRGAIYPITLMSFGHFEADESTKTLAITANLSAWEDRSIFNMEIRLVFDGTRFTPVGMASWDEASYGADKGQGKEIRSMDDYLQFDDPL